MTFSFINDLPDCVQSSTLNTAALDALKQLICHIPIWIIKALYKLGDYTGNSLLSPAP